MNIFVPRTKKIFNFTCLTLIVLCASLNAKSQSDLNAHDSADFVMYRAMINSYILPCDSIENQLNRIIEQEKVKFSALPFKNGIRGSGAIILLKKSGKIKKIEWVYSDDLEQNSALKFYKDIFTTYFKHINYFNNKYIDYYGELAYIREVLVMIEIGSDGKVILNSCN